MVFQEHPSIFQQLMSVGFLCVAYGNQIDQPLAFLIWIVLVLICLGSANYPVSVDWRGKTSLTSKTHIAESVDHWNGRVAEAAWLHAGAQCLGQLWESVPNRCNVVEVCLCYCFCLCFSFGRQMNRHLLCFQCTD